MALVETIKLRPKKKTIRQQQLADHMIWQDKYNQANYLKEDKILIPDFSLLTKYYELTEKF